MIRMLHGFLDGNNFRLGLTSILTSYKHEFLNDAAVWNAFDQAKQPTHPSLNVASVMRTWTKQGGYPVVTVKRFYGTNTARVAQSRYYSTEPLQDSR